jgi:hypothetical protein
VLLTGGSMKVSDKLSKVSDSFTVNMYDNGFMVDVSGRNEDNDWASAKILCNDLDSMLAVVTEISHLPRDN